VQAVKGRVGDRRQVSLDDRVLAQIQMHGESASNVTFDCFPLHGG